MLKNRLLPKTFTADDELMVTGQANAQHLGGTIRCLLWNIFKAKRSHWLDDFAELVADRDLVLLQEAVRKAPSDPLFAAQARLEWVMARSFYHPVTRTEHGVKTGARCKALEQQFFLSPHAEPFSQTQKLLLSTKYSLIGGKESLLVLNMHAINFVSIEKYAKQLEQLSVALEQHTGPVVLGGDFNTWNPRRLWHFMRVTRSAGLIEAKMSRPRKLVHMRQHLDHLFYRGLSLRSVESLGYYKSSDHAPITATFEYPTRVESHLNQNQSWGSA